MTQDERLIPARPGADFETRLSELSQSRAYGKYGRYGVANETNLREYLHIILKRKWIILSLILIITSLVTIQAYRQPSIYEGATIIQIQPRQQSVLQTGQISIAAPTDPKFWETQLRLLQRPELARQVILTLDLEHNPNFLGGQAQSGVFDSLKRLFARPPKRAASSSTNSTVQTVGEEELRERQFSDEELEKLEPYEDAIINNEIIEPIEKTSLVTIRYNHTNPELAQKIANTLADVFVQNNIERIETGTSKAEQDLAKGIAEVQQRITKQERERFQFAKDHNLPIDNSPGSNLEQLKLQTYAGQLMAAENERRTAQAAYESAKNAPDPFSAPEIQKDERIVKLREKLSDLEDKLSALKTRYTPEWPEVKQVQNQISDLKAELNKAPREVLASLKAQAERAAAHEKSLQAAYSSQHGTTTQQTKDQIDMAVMTQALETDKQYLNTLTQKMRELGAGGSTVGEVSVQTRSRLPREPVGPQRVRSIIIAFVLSLIAGVGLAFLLDFLDDTLKTIDDVDRYIHLPALALIPAAANDKARLRGGPQPAESPVTALALMSDVRSPIAESYRHLRTSLLLSAAGTPPKTVLVTSSQPSEGKTTTAINTAFMFAQTGAEVLIIDCDLRRPRLHSHFNVPNVRGITNMLSGESKEIDSIVQTYEKQPNLKLLTSGPIPPNPAELLGSNAMREVLATLGARYTHIIVDSPPAISFTDASILSTMVDGVILVVHGGRSSRAVVRRAKQQLLDVGANIYGVVLNNVKVESQDYYYGGYYSGYYSYYDDEASSTPNAPAGAK